MYIAPNSTVKLFKNCPLDKSYENTIYFASVSAQTNYFSSLTGYTFTNQTYQRVHKGKIRVAMNAEPLYNCNYMAFQNASFGSKWFYAFILAVEYVNNVTSEITYEIDVLQTWHFDYILEQCFIERQHTETDNAGENLIPENLELGEYVVDDFFVTGLLNTFYIVLGCTFDSSFQDATGDLYSGIYSGLQFHAFTNDAAGVAACNSFITDATIYGKSSGIVCIFLMPSTMVNAKGSTAPSARTYSIAKPDQYHAIGGYIPKNKKLYCYPYNFLYATNMQGNAAIFPYEYFSGSTCDFQISGDMSPNPSVIMCPVNYKGITGVNFDEKMVLSGYPQLSFNIDSYKAWLAQNATSLAVNATATAATALANPISGLVGAASLVAQVYEHSIMPNQARGGAGSSANCAHGLQEFAFSHKHIRPEFMAIVDDYFNMFGYAIHRVRIPDRNARPEWTYVKTVGCKISPAATSGLPGDDTEKIEQLYNSGIRWWNNPAHIGNYTYNNAPVTT